MTPPARRKAALIVGGWTLVALFLFTKNLAARTTARRIRSPWFDILLAWLIGLLHLGRADAGHPLARRALPNRPRPWAAPLAIHLAGSVVFAVVQLWLEAVVTVWTGRLLVPRRPLGRHLLPGARSRSASTAASSATG